ncbi:hypothetical protein E4T48_01959 [Aureobasidium sp. EXF-10727]|nr:hypothetical protein E4T48_01959 [Aureobasidium sp. EXF-10727]
MNVSQVSHESFAQVPERTIGSSLPSYESIQDDIGHTTGASGIPAITQPPPGFDPAGQRKSHAISTFQISNEQAHIEGWPAEPRKLRDKTLLTLFFNLCEALITLAPIAFIVVYPIAAYFSVIAILVAKLDGEATGGNGLGHNIRAITRLGPSIYPIMFAAVAGKSLKTFARYYAERGTELGVLELLLASQTVWGTFESQILLRRFTLFGAHLFLLWCLSPLGGQASLRVLNISMKAETTGGQPVLYLATGGMSSHGMENGVLASGDAATSLAAIDALYSASLLAPLSVKSSDADTWGNVKIPWLPVPDLSLRNTLPGDWSTIPGLISADNYTSLVGLPLAGLIRNSQILQKFSFDYAYMDLKCPLPAYNISKKDPDFVKHLGLIWSSNNKSMFTNDAKKTITSFFLDTHTPMSDKRVDNFLLDQNSTTRSDVSLQSPRNILFGSLDSASSTVLLRSCTVEQIYLEAQAQCTDNGCKVNAVRPSIKYRDRNPNLTLLESFVLSYHFMQDFPLATGSIHNGDTSPTEYYVRGAHMPFGASTAGLPELASIPNDLFAIRMGQLINTYLQLSLAPLAYTGDLPGPSEDIWKTSNQSIITEVYDDTLPPFLPISSNTTITRTTEVYRCNYLWFAFFLISSCILLLLGSAGTALSHLCNAPDMMGYVASFTYNNPYMIVPPGGESLGAMERARLLRDVKVKIGDARVDDEVGHVVFATLDRADTIGDLSLVKHYR